MGKIMRSLIRPTMLSGAGALAAILAASAANAAVTISTAATSNMSCVSGVCTPTAVKFHSLYEFQNTIDGVRPYTGLMVDAAGILYGTANIGGLVGGACGIDGCGTVYRVTPKGKESVLYSFKGGSTDGSYPDGGLIRDASGNLYGTAAVAGPGNAGIIFKLT